MVRETIVMIVDDDDDDRLLFVEAVKEIDSTIHCVEAAEGEECLEILKRVQKLPDLIFLDLNMPGINGKQCLRCIKENRRLKHIPVIIYSTSKRAEDFEETNRLGALNFVVKPSRFEEITRFIAESLDEVHQMIQRSHS